MGRHGLVREPFTRRAVVGAAALTASAALTAGLAFGDGQAQAAIPQVTSGLASVHNWSTATFDQLIAALGIESRGIAGGTAVSPENLASALSELLNIDSATIERVLGILRVAGVQFGNGTAIAILPGVAAAIPSGEGSSAAALAILGAAVATDGLTDTINDIWDVVIIPGILGRPGTTVGDLAQRAGIKRSNLPDDTVVCLGVFAAANSKTAGSCVNILLTVDARYLKISDGAQSGEVQLALTNPLSLIRLVTDPDQLSEIVDQAVSGDPIHITRDFLRLSLNGPENLALTSNYGYVGPLRISWLGSNLVLSPGTATTHGVNGPDFVNYLSLPTFSFNTPSSALQLIPTFDVADFNVLDLFTIPGFNTGEWLPGLGSSSSASATVSALSLRKAQPSLMSVSAEDDQSIDLVANADDSGDGGADDGGSTGGGTGGDLETGAETGGEGNVNPAPLLDPVEDDVPAQVVVDDDDSDQANPDPQPEPEPERAPSEEAASGDVEINDPTDDETQEDEPNVDPASSPAVKPAA
ncbi:hypothetical protein ABLE92_13485 [Gordonia sp. VNQ95]|uniref:hypothetical protein n=1 Tax=Gordonia sp. VNQ95 TaxID=3156619 RepID=UPI0032B48B76